MLYYTSCIAVTPRMDTVTNLCK